MYNRTGDALADVARISTGNITHISLSLSSYSVSFSFLCVVCLYLSSSPHHDPRDLSLLERKDSQIDKSSLLEVTFGRARQWFLLLIVKRQGILRSVV